MKQKFFSLLTLALFFCSGAWAQDFTYALSSFTVTNTTYTYEFSENKLQNKTAWVEVPSSNSEGTITFKCSGSKNDRFLYIYGTNGTVKDETRKIVMNTSWPTAIAFSSSDIKTNDGKYYLVFSTSDDFKATGVKYTLTDPSGLEISPASGYYAGKASVTMSANDGYTIYYTDNGTTPSKSSTVYTGSFDVTSDKTIKAIAYKGEDYGFVMTAEYTIVPENRTYLADPTAADFTALRGNTTNFEDDTANGYIKNKVQFNANTDYALEGSDGTDISVAQGLLIRSTSNFSVGDFRYYYKDDDYKFYSNKSNTSYKIPAVKAGQKVIFEMSAGGSRTITGTNTDEASQSYTSGSIKKLTFTATADGTVTLTNSGSSYVYSIEVKTPVYYTVTYDLNGGTGTLPTETDKEEGDKFDLHDGVTGITAPGGKEFSKWKDQDDNLFDGGAEYTMPNKDVTLTAQWIDEVVKYTVTEGTHSNGSITIDKTSIAAGETVTLTATPNLRYLFGSWTITKTSDDSDVTASVSLSSSTSSSATFTMPAYGVTVNATFNSDARKQILYLTTTAKATTEANDKLYAALNSVDDYNVIVEAPASQTLTNYDLIVLHESIGGTSDATAVTGCKTTTTPVLNTKSYFYGADGDNTKRWQWAAPNNGKAAQKVATLNTSYANITTHPIYAGVTINDNGIKVLSDDVTSGNTMQPITNCVAGKEGYTLATTPNKSSGNGADIHELTPTQRGVPSGKFLMISVSNAGLDNLTTDGQLLFKNAAAYLLDAGASWSPVTASVTTNKGKWTSYTPSWDVTLEDGATAYFVTAVTSSTITATPVSVLKAGDGYFIKGADALTEYAVLGTAEDADDTTGTLMVGQLSSTTINATTPDSNDKFVLGTTAGGTSGLFKVNSDVTVAAGKAYLNSGTTGLANSLTIDFEDGEATGIQTIEAKKELLEGDFYNLNGQKVAQPTKGLYIVNGRKVIIK